MFTFGRVKSLRIRVSIWGLGYNNECKNVQGNANMTPIMVSTYKSPKKAELYLFIPKEKGLESLADELLVMFGEPEHIIDFDLTPDRKMPRCDATQVYKDLQTKGYFMQMPPTEVEKISDMPAPPPHLDNIF